MDNRLHPSVTPCRFLRAGHCRSGDGCEYAHDSIPQPCLSASQISHRLDNLSGSDITDPVERRRTHQLRARLLYKAKRRCIAPQLVHSGIIPTRKAIRKYYASIKGRRAPAAAGAGGCGPIGSIPAISAISCRSGNDGGDAGDDDGGGGWVTVEAKSNERRLRKMQFRKRAPGHRPVRIVKRHRTEQAGSVGSRQARRAELDVRNGLPGTEGVRMGSYHVGPSRIVPKVEDNDEGEGGPRRIEKIGDFTVKYPSGRPAHLGHLDGGEPTRIKQEPGL